MRRFVVVGRKAKGTPDFSLADLPSTSGRMDVLLRCLRASLLVSHGLRPDAVVYLVLAGSEPVRALRFDGAAARYLRPDERSLATTVQKTLRSTGTAEGFELVRPGIALSNGGLEAVLRDVPLDAPYVLDQAGPDIRSVHLGLDHPVFFLGDHLGLSAKDRARLDALGALPVSIGPVSVQADDAVAVVSNELDRRVLRTVDALAGRG
jgi:tRNA (pseudouridine54-N1)-methyltransferase